LWMLDHLVRRRLPHIDDRKPRQMPLMHFGGSQSAWLWGRTLGFSWLWCFQLLLGGIARFQRGTRIMNLHAPPPCLREVRGVFALGFGRICGERGTDPGWESSPSGPSAADSFRSDLGAGGSNGAFVVGQASPPGVPCRRWL